uniref:Methyltransferase domain-containing protein n=1 Tax=viral metagenome TaxID=1070528 RepID=A0A6C0I5M8_9ZZZZ
MSKLDKEYFDNDETGEKTITFEDPSDIYDDFYAKIYDQLFSTPERISFEKTMIEANALAAWPIAETKILDACCGTSPHSEWLCKTEVDIVGVDISEAMLTRARQKCSRARFYRGDVSRTETFPPKTFSHAMLLYFSIYQFQNPKLVFDNLYTWMKPGGVLVVHLVNPDKFDPILDAASPFVAFSLQKYSKERVMDSEISFDQFNYKSRFIKDKEKEGATFEEIVTYQDPSKNEGNKYRENKHRMFMPSLDAMMDIIASSGFSRHEMVDMVTAGFEYQYLMFFTK